MAAANAVVIVKAKAEADCQIMKREAVLRVKRLLLDIGVTVKCKQAATPPQIILQ